MSAPDDMGKEDRAVENASRGSEEEEEEGQAEGVRLGAPYDLSAPMKLRDMKKVFDRYDVDGSGEIEVAEIMNGLLPDLGITSFKEADVMKLMEELDSDGNGVVDFSEFVIFYELLRASLTDQRRNSMPSNCEDLVKVIQDKRHAKDAYLTQRQIEVRKRIYTLLYDLPCFAPDYIYRRWWDVVILVLLLYMFIVPTVVSALAVVPSPISITIDWLVTLVMSCDIAINLNTAVQEHDAFVLELRRGRIFKHYLTKGLMPIDVLSAIPVGLIVHHTSGNMTAYRALVLLRCCKLTKFTFLFHLTNRGTMDPSFVQFYFWTVPLLKFAFKMLSMGHILTMLRLIISMTLEDTGCPVYGKDSCTDAVFEKYFYSFFWVWSLLTTQGTAALDGILSYMYAALVMLMSLLLQGHVVANMSAVVLKSNVEAQNQDAMRSTLAIMKHYKIPSTLQQEVLSFQFHSLQQNAAASLAHILERLPPSMQREVGLYVKVELVTKVPMFQELDPECRLAVANCLEQTFAEPHDLIIEYGEVGTAMYFMMHGFADVIVPYTDSDEQGNEVKTGRIVATIIRGDFFGEIALLKPELKRTASIQALTYCNLFKLDFEDLQDLFTKWSQIHKTLDKEARARGLRTTKAPRAAPVQFQEQPWGGARRQSLLASRAPLGVRRSSSVVVEDKDAEEMERKESVVQSVPSFGAQPLAEPSFGRFPPEHDRPGIISKPPQPPPPPPPAPLPPPPPPPAVSNQPSPGQAATHDAGKPSPFHVGSISPPGDTSSYFSFQPSRRHEPEAEQDISPQLKKIFVSIAKQLEIGNDKFQKLMLREMRTYTQRLEDLEMRMDHVLAKVDEKARREDGLYGQLFTPDRRRSQAKW